MIEYFRDLGDGYGLAPIGELDDRPDLDPFIGQALDAQKLAEGCGLAGDPSGISRVAEPGVVGMIEKTSRYFAWAFRSIASLARIAPANSVSDHGQWNEPRSAPGRSWSTSLSLTEDDPIQIALMPYSSRRR